MFKTVITISAALALSGALRGNGEDSLSRGYGLSTQFGAFYTDGVLNAAVQNQEPEGAAVFAYYKMDDYAATYTVLDSSGNGRDAALGEPTDSISSDGLANGCLTSHCFFGGLLVNESIPAIMSGDFSVAAWLKLSQAEPSTAIFFTPADGNNCFARIVNDGTLFAVFGGEPVQFTVNAFPAWHHVVFVKRGAAFTVYYDGAALGDVSVGGNYTASWVWFDSASDLYNHVELDELIFYKGALTAQQATELYESYDGPTFGTITYDIDYYNSDMGLPGACTIEYSSKMYVEGTEIGAFPAVTSNDPRYSFSSWVYAGQGDYLYEYSTVYDGLAAAANWVTVSPASALYFDSQGGSSVSEWWDLYEGFTFEIPYFGHYFPADPAYEGYAFSGWFSGTDGTGNPITPQAVYDSMTFGTGYMYAFAYWTLPPITFTFNAGTPPYGGGISGTDIAGIENYVTYDYTEIAYGAGAEVTALPSAGVTGPRYTFSGYWYEPYYATVYYTGCFAPMNNYPFGGPIPLYAVWDDGGFDGTLAFDSMDGTPVTLTKNLFDGSDFGTGDFGELLWPDPPARAGYIFDGWNTQADGQGLAGVTYATQYVTAYGSAVTLYAMWAAE